MCVPVGVSAEGSGWVCVPFAVSVGGVGGCVTAMCGSHQPPLLPCVVMYVHRLAL